MATKRVASAIMRSAASPPARRDSAASLASERSAPADELAVPVLSAIAAATGDAARAERSLAKLAALSRRAGGDAADRMIADATRFVAIRAAADAYARGRGDKARRFLELAKKQRGGHGNAELSHDLAVLDLDAGRVDQAIAQLERLTGDVPEAWVNLALAYERKGQRARALETLERAERAGVRFAPLKDWIAAKQRILGRGGEP